MKKKKAMVCCRCVHFTDFTVHIYRDCHALLNQKKWFVCFVVSIYDFSLLKCFYKVSYLSCKCDRTFDIHCFILPMLAVANSAALHFGPLKFTKLFFSYSETEE